jgi:hypothetical protein
MKKKSMLAVILALVLMMAVLPAGCGKADDAAKGNGSKENDAKTDEATDAKSGEVQMWDGYYYYIIADMGIESFVRFNEDGTYYASYFDDAATDAGTYEVLDEELDYYPDTTGDDVGDADGEAVKASQVVALTSYVTGETQKVAYVDDALLDMSLGGLGNHRNLRHKADYAYVVENEEMPIEIAAYFAGGSTGSAITLGHNGSFMDATGDELLEGIWEQKGAGEYALTYDDGTKGTLKIADDKKTAELTRGDEVVVVEAMGAEGSMFTLSNPSVEVGVPITVELRLDCAEDGTCELFLVVSQVDAEISIDKGTYTMSDVAKGSFEFEVAGACEAAPDYETATDNGVDVNLAYKADMNVSLNGQSADISIDTVLTGTYSK